MQMHWTRGFNPQSAKTVPIVDDDTRQTVGHFYAGPPMTSRYIDIAIDAFNEKVQQMRKEPELEPEEQESKKERQSKLKMSDLKWH